MAELDLAQIQAQAEAASTFTTSKPSKASGYNFGELVPVHELDTADGRSGIIVMGDNLAADAVFYHTARATVLALCAELEALRGGTTPTVEERIARLERRIAALEQTADGR